LNFETGKPAVLEPLFVMPERYFKNPLSGTHIETLDPTQMDAVLELQQKVAASIPEELFECDNASFYSELFKGKGRILGLFHQREIVACSVISLPGSHSPDNLGRHINLEKEQLERVVNLESAYVDPSYQGRGIAKLLSAMQLEFATQLGKRHALSTASPANLYSLKNLFSLGFSIRYICKKYENKIRCIMYRDLLKLNNKDDFKTDFQGQWVPFANLATQKNLLRKGYRGVSVKGTLKDFLIFYCK
jgi:GNAT superfamily N-acetyltransferase